jgi:hypothetical protein
MKKIIRIILGVIVNIAIYLLIYQAYKRAIYDKFGIAFLGGGLGTVVTGLIFGLIKFEDK